MRTSPVVLALCAQVLVTTGCYRPLVANNEIRAGAIQDVLARAEHARGLRSDTPVNVQVVSAAELGATVRRAMLAPWKDDELARYERSLIAVGLWPPERRLLDEMASTLGAEAVGLYIPEDRSLYVVSNPTVPLSVRVASAIAHRDLVREYALAHELVHFLQHQGYPALFAEVMRIKDSDDAVWAAQAAIEGDAVRYGFAALGPAASPPPPNDFQARMEAAIVGSPLGREPRLIRDGIVFPYGYGYRLSMLEATLLLDDPPASTEQALHLDKRHEPFTVFGLPESQALAPDCSAQWENTVGELGLSMLLRDLSPAPDPRAWQGWDGDRYVAFACGDKPAFVWLTSWDTEIDALQFADAYRAIAPAIARRAALASEPSVEVKGKDVLMFSPEVTAYAGSVVASATRRRARTLDEAFAAAAEGAEAASRFTRPDPIRSGDGR